MARLPQPGGDNNNWGNILNDYLSQVHKPDGTLKDNSVGSAQLADNAVTSAAIAPGAITAIEIADVTIEETQLAPSLQTKLNQSAPTWTTLSDKPTVIAAGTTQAAARAVIDAYAKPTGGIPLADIKQSELDTAYAPRETLGAKLRRLAGTANDPFTEPSWVPAPNWTPSTAYTVGRVVKKRIKILYMCRCRHIRIKWRSDINQWARHGRWHCELDLLWTSYHGAY